MADGSDGGAVEPDPSPAEVGDGRRPAAGRSLAFDVIWPGLGLVHAGSRVVGAGVALLVAAPAAASLWWLTTRPPERLALLAVSPTMLRTVVVVALVGLVARCALLLAVADRSLRRRPNGTVQRQPDGGLTWPWSTRMAVFVTATVLAVPHVAVAGYAADQLSLLDAIFVTGATEVALPTPLEGDAGDSGQLGSQPVSTDATDATEAAEQVPGDEVTDADGVSATTWNGRERLTVALLGGDSGFDRTGVRTDSIIIVSVDVATGDAVAFSVPRNWERMPFPRGTPAARAYPRGFDDLANAVYGMGEARPELFPGSRDPAGTAIKQSLAQLLGIPIDHYVLVDMHAVVDSIDLFGGIELTIAERIRDGSGPIDPGGPPLDLTLDPGRQHLDGRTALAYARARTTSSDYRRMERQRCVIGALVDQVTVLEAVRHYDGVRSIMRRHVTTDIPVDQLPALLDLAGRLDTERIITVNFVPPDFPTGRAPVTLVRETVDEVLRRQHQDRVLAGLDLDTGIAGPPVARPVPAPPTTVPAPGVGTPTTRRGDTTTTSTTLTDSSPGQELAAACDGPVDAEPVTRPRGGRP